MERSSRAGLVFSLSIFVLSAVASRAAAGPPLPHFNFRDAATVAQWHPAHHIASAHTSVDGMEVEASGDDPFLEGPAVDLPAGDPLAVEVKVRSERGGAVEIFYFTDHAAAGKSVAARVAPGVWETVRLPLPPLEGKVRFRIDPPAVAGGKATIASLAIHRRVVVKEPRWPRPVAPLRGAGRLTVDSGDVSLVHDGEAVGRFELRVGGRVMASSLSGSMVGYLKDGHAHFSAFPKSGAVKGDRDAVRETFAWKDEHGGNWSVARTYMPGSVPGSIAVDTTIRVDPARELLFAPALVLLPGAGEDGFGATKQQVLLSGLEYLGPDDASSSEADVIGPASKRRVPDSLKLTIPLMAYCGDGRYVAMAWEEHPHVSALFDSPDRTFGSGGHLMGLLLPGSDGRNRIEGSLFPEVPLTLQGPVTVRAVLLGGTGRSVVPAVKQYVEMRPPPPVPDVGMDARQYYRWAAGGWLDSKIREGSLVRHAVWPGFGAQPAADAAVSMRWLAAQTDDVALRGRLASAAAEVAGAVRPDQYDSAAVSHVRVPVASLVLQNAGDAAARAAERGRDMVRRFEPDGSVRFIRETGKDDFARTNPTPFANGLTATHVCRVLEAAAFSGDPELIAEGLRLLRAMDRDEHDVPRGAQSWEVPLHTPDVLASAWLVRAYVTGYELTGDKQLLEKAAYWAWTGVPFVYLRQPADGAVGPYATIAVYGATNWVAPVWFGQPVQWCGLVYADALYRLAEHDTSGPWKRLADGITASGIQQSWPGSDRERSGLLPDFFHLRAQIADGPAINPGTLQANAVRLFGGPPVYDFHRFRGAGLLVHAPGRIEVMADEPGRSAFRVRGWPREPYSVLVGGIQFAPTVRVNGAAAAGDGWTFDPQTGRGVLRAGETVEVEITK